MSKIAGNDVDNIQEYLYSEIYGLIRRFPYFVGHNKNSNLYKLTQAIDRQKYRLDDIIEIIKNYRKIYGEMWEIAIGESLENIGKNVGINRILYEPDTSYINRLFYLNNFSIIGATEDEIRTAIYYFINNDEFNKDTQISILNPYTESTYNFVSGGSYNFVTINTEEQYKKNFISETQIGDEFFQIKISLPSGSDTDRKTYEYWSKETNLSLLYTFIKSLSPIGVIFTMKIERNDPFIIQDRAFELNILKS